MAAHGMLAFACLLFDSALLCYDDTRLNDAVRSVIL